MHPPLASTRARDIRAGADKRPAFLDTDFAWAYRLGERETAPVVERAEAPEIVK